ncbi:MAG TPA: hypothetical protein VET48_02430, partial [Steroidobacteraceae bacterium]|nr:hypothetical protein [Steroidobacteraceae bacterium]
MLTFLHSLQSNRKGLLFSLLTITSVLSYFGMAPAHAASITVRVVRHGEDVLILHPEIIAGKLATLVASCSVNSTANLQRESWQTIATSDSFVHVVFPKPRSIVVQTGNRRRDERMIREILMPLPEGNWPEYILIKT